MNIKFTQSLFQTLVLVAVLALGWICWGQNDLTSNKVTTSKFRFLPRRKATEEVTISNSTSLLTKECMNVLYNLTVGSWIGLPDANITAFDLTYRNYWREKGILKNMWRDDGKCGYKNAQTKVVASKWPAVGSWCNKDGPRPCCTDLHDGMCVAPSKAPCDCQSCVDTRMYLYAELSQWKPWDPRCTWIRFSGFQACEVIKRSPFDDIYFVGDSLMRNMFAGFVMTLNDDTVRGAWGKGMTGKQKEKCVAERFFFWDDCRTVIKTLDDVLQPEKLCSGVSKSNFTATTHVYFSLTESAKFRELMKSLIGKRGSLLLVGVGVHMNLHAPSVINKYLEPALKIRKDFYKNTNASIDSRWPRVFFILPLLTGLLRPIEYIPYQNNQASAKYSREMRVYCEKHNIPLFDFRQITKLVHSFDGSHYGLGVNLMKNQILLHYLAELTHTRSNE